MNDILSEEARRRTGYQMATNFDLEKDGL